MKGILIVRYSDMVEKTELMGNLSMQSERVSRIKDEVFFHSKEGALMTMICALLDQEVTYRLEFKTTSVKSK